jgi:hypothetical protein
MPQSENLYADNYVKNTAVLPVCIFVDAYPQPLTHINAAPPIPVTIAATP